jgi:hypothetical protein
MPKDSNADKESMEEKFFASQLLSPPSLRK